MNLQFLKCSCVKKFAGPEGAVEEAGCGTNPTEDGLPVTRARNRRLNPNTRAAVFRQSQSLPPGDNGRHSHTSQARSTQHLPRGRAGAHGEGHAGAQGQPVPASHFPAARPQAPQHLPGPFAHHFLPGCHPSPRARQSSSGCTRYIRKENSL